MSTGSAAFGNHKAIKKFLAGCDPLTEELWRLKTDTFLAEANQATKDEKDAKQELNTLTDSDEQEEAEDRMKEANKTKKRNESLMRGFNIAMMLIARNQVFFGKGNKMWVFLFAWFADLRKKAVPQRKDSAFGLLRVAHDLVANKNYEMGTMHALRNYAEEYAKEYPAQPLWEVFKPEGVALTLRNQEVQGAWNNKRDKAQANWRGLWEFLEYLQDNNWFDAVEIAAMGNLPTWEDLAMDLKGPMADKRRPPGY